MRHGLVCLVVILCKMIMRRMRRTQDGIIFQEHRRPLHRAENGDGRYEQESPCSSGVVRVQTPIPSGSQTYSSEGMYYSSIRVYYTS